MDEHTFMLLYKAVRHPHFEFANSVLCPFKLGDIKEIEKSKRGSQNSIKLKKINQTGWIAKYYT